MNEVTYQTVKLGKGKHSSPRHGACVMELASMLAGETFTDHPRCVSRTIASFLRSYNDMLDDDRRQDLYQYAAATVGTAASDDVEDLRIAHLLAWAGEQRAHRSRWTRLLGIERRPAAAERRKGPESAARYAIQSIRRLSDETHASVLALLDELIDIAPAPRSPAGDARPLRAAAVLPGSKLGGVI